MVKSSFAERASVWLRSYATNTIERHRVIVYLLHSVLVVGVVFLHFMGLGGSHERLPLLMSATHAAICLFSLSLFLKRYLTLSKAFSLTSLLAQCTIAARLFFFSTVRPDHFLQFIIINQITSLMAVVFLVMCFVKYTPFLIATISIVAYGTTAVYLQESALWRVFAFFFFMQYFICLLGELLRRNVMRVSMENKNLLHRETALMRAIRLNGKEIEGYLRMSSNANPSKEDVDRLFSMLRLSSKRNIINAVRLHLKNHLTDNCDLTSLFPQLTKSEVEVCNLIVQGKKRGEIASLLGKTEKNIDVVRTHVRRKLDVSANQDLRNFLVELLIEKGYDF